MGCSSPMPKYKCYKEVHALAISNVEILGDGSAVLSFSEDSYGPRQVSRDYVKKHNPAAPGYFVVYSDGYESWSPADAFESGYERVV